MNGGKNGQSSAKQVPAVPQNLPPARPVIQRSGITAMLAESYAPIRKNENKMIGAEAAEAVEAIAEESSSEDEEEKKEKKEEKKEEEEKKSEEEEEDDLPMEAKELTCKRW